MSLSVRKDIFSTANNTIMLKMMIRHEHNDCCLAYWMDLMSFVDIDDDDNAYTDICHINPMMNIECVQFSQDAFSKFRKSHNSHDQPGTGASRLPQACPAGLTPDSQYSWIPAGGDGCAAPPAWHPAKGVNFNASCLTVDFYARRFASGFRFGTAGSAMTFVLYLTPLKMLRKSNINLSIKQHTYYCSSISISWRNTIFLV
ncbi:hypothetical protein DERF_002760 [Dermatophagoides farinae]|uniref:Uncharacterized protein n=1 Tax=Dermatophagoides farinae TaxID=6954 RepID=A0A922ID02_DERFA|nr:hypothetical protein DERF_002760 [Dermatophagoides farinae]